MASALAHPVRARLVGDRNPERRRAEPALPGSGAARVRLRGPFLILMSINSAEALLVRAGQEQFHGSLIIRSPRRLDLRHPHRPTDRRPVTSAILTRALAVLLLLVAVAGYVVVRAGTALR